MTLSLKMHRMMKGIFFLRVKLNNYHGHSCAKLHLRIPIPWERSGTGNYSSDFRRYKQLIAQNLGIDVLRAGVLLRNNLHLIEIEEKKLINNCQICKDLEVDLQNDINDIKFLELAGEDLENRILLLKEMGARYISAGMLRTCASRAHVVTFKSYAKIPEDVVISDNLYSHLHEPPPDVPDLEPLSEFLKVGEYKRKCLIHWIKWRLEVPEENNKLAESLSYSLRYKSFSRLKSCFDILHREFGFSVRTIREGGYLKDTSPVNLKHIVTELPIICGVSVKNLLQENPILRKMKYKGVLKVRDLLVEFGVTSEQVLRTPSVLLLDPDTLKVGLETIEESPELKSLINHPQLLQVLVTRDRLRNRLAYLRYLSIPDASVDILGKSVSIFNQYLRSGTHRKRGRDIALMLQNHLKKDSNEIEREIKRHPLWRHVDSMTIHQTLAYLMNSFSEDDIYQNLQLLLYPKEKVDISLSSLIEMNKLLDEENRYTRSQLLALCGYQIEKEFHFTGDGVFNKGQPVPISKKPEEFSKENEEWKKDDAKNPLNDANIFRFIKTNKNQSLP